jgi:3,4-dihydroxy 2-butanone 4-phosphate synthase/GTP cyclohydrolase II
VNNDLLGTLTNADKQLDDMFKVINAQEGAVIFINQDMLSVNLLSRLAELKILQAGNQSTKIKIDSKDFGIGAQILHDIDILRLDWYLILNKENVSE